MYGPDWWQESLRTFQRIHASDPVDVIASQSGGARACIEAQRRLPVEERVPSVLILHNTNIDNLHSHLKQIYRHPARAILRWIPRDIVLWRDNRRWLHFADHITVLSQSSALALVRWHPVEKSQVTVIPNGVDVEGITTAEVQRGEVRRQMGLHDQDTQVWSREKASTTCSMRLLRRSCASMDILSVLFSLAKGRCVRSWRGNAHALAWQSRCYLLAVFLTRKFLVC
jgi:hypothetical protein